MIEEKESVDALTINLGHDAEITTGLSKLGFSQGLPENTPVIILNINGEATVITLRDPFATSNFFDAVDQLRKSLLIHLHNELCDRDAAEEGEEA